MNGLNMPTWQCPTEGEPPEPRATQAQLEGLIGQLDVALVAKGYFHPPDRTPATRNTIRTMLTKPGWSNREVQAMRGIVRALSEPTRKRMDRTRARRPSSGRRIGRIHRRSRLRPVGRKAR